MLRRANSLAIVGDAFARPLVEALDAEPDRWDISSLRIVSSSSSCLNSSIIRCLATHQPANNLAHNFSCLVDLGLAGVFA